MYRGPIVDCDVHHRWRSPRDLLPYLPDRWRAYATASGEGLMLPVDPGRVTYPHVNGLHSRIDAFAPDGSLPGSDYDTMRRQLLDPKCITRALLQFEVGMQGGMQNPYWASALCSAANDWNIANWLERDERLYGGVLVGPELPVEAAAEIRRVGSHPKFAEVLLVANPIGKPFGHPLFDPIFDAAQEMELPIAIHLGGVTITKGHESAGGQPQSILEHLTLVAQAGLHYIAAMIQHGVFEKFPRLKVMFVEFGFTAVVPLLWRLDALFDVLRAESPWVTRRPSEYVLDHIKFTTQPLEQMPEDALEALQAFEGIDDLLCFSSDYPHWDADEPVRLAKVFPDAWLPKIMAGNAAAVFGWPELTESPAPAVGSPTE